LEDDITKLSLNKSLDKSSELRYLTQEQEESAI